MFINTGDILLGYLYIRNYLIVLNGLITNIFYACLDKLHEKINPLTDKMILTYFKLIFCVWNTHELFIQYNVYVVITC